MHPLPSAEPVPSVTQKRSLEAAVAVFLALALLGATTAVLSKHYQAELRHRGEVYFQRGSKLANEGHLEKAVDEFRSALACSHENTRYNLALAVALLNLGKLDAAKAYLLRLAEREPNDSQVNLMLARIAAHQDNLEDAISYYRRAIYGLWRQDPVKNRINAQFELIDLLTGNGRNRQALAQLMQLAGDAPDQPAVKNRIGMLLLKLGSPSNAADVFRDVLGGDPRNAEATTGLAEAHFALGKYKAARTEFARAARIDPKNSFARQKLEETEQILDLDPTPVTLSGSERYARSRELVRLTLNAFQQCLDRASPDQLAPVQELVQQATGILTKPVRRGYADATSRSIAVAEQLWKRRIAICGSPLPGEEALSLLMLELAK